MLEYEPEAAPATAPATTPAAAPTASAAFLVVASIFAPVETPIFASVDASLFAFIAQIPKATHIRSTFRSVLPKDIGHYSICGGSQLCSLGYSWEMYGVTTKGREPPRKWDAARVVGEDLIGLPNHPRACRFQCCLGQDRCRSPGMHWRLACQWFHQR